MFRINFFLGCLMKNTSRGDYEKQFFLYKMNLESEKMYFLFYTVFENKNIFRLENEKFIKIPGYEKMLFPSIFLEKFFLK